METRLPYYLKLLNDELVVRVERNPSYSMRAFANFLAIESSALSQFLRGKRFLSEVRARRLLNRLDLNPVEQENFLRSMNQARLNAGLKRMSPSQKLFAHRGSLSSITKTRDLSSEVFKAISDWYHYAILELCRLGNFEPNVKWIADKLAINETQAKAAVDRLFELELLRSENGTWIKTQNYLNTADKSVTTPALRMRQKQIIQKSLVALECEPIELRNHSARTVAIDISRLNEAKKRIEQFMTDLCDELATGKISAVYELSVQLFPLTKTQTQESEQT